MRLFLKGSRCWSPKCALEKRPRPPGQQTRRRTKRSDYGRQLREKQKVKRMYGLLEKQFHRYFVMADRKKGVTGENLLQFLERRLDNVVFRMGFAINRAEARQLVNHGHFLLNGRRARIPSILVRPGDVVSVRERSKELQRIREALDLAERGERPSWLQVDREALRGKVLALPERKDIDPDGKIADQLIVEFYSK